MYLDILSIIAPIILTALLGFLWSHFNCRYDGQFISAFVMNIATPCLIVATLSQAELADGQLLQMSLITLTGLLSLFIFYGVLIKLLKDDFRVYFNPSVFANTGNMGAPICLFAFGEQALALALVVFMVTSLLHFSIGVSVAGSRSHDGTASDAQENPLLTMLKSPIFYAASLSSVLLLGDLELPKALFNTIDLIGAVAIPLMLFSLGVSLHSLKVSDLGRNSFYALARLIVGFSTGMLLCWLFQLEGMLRGIVLIQSAMPAAVFNYLLAMNANRQPVSVAAVVVISTLLSFLSLPLLLWYVL